MINIDQSIPERVKRVGRDPEAAFIGCRSAGWRRAEGMVQGIWFFRIAFKDPREDP